MRICTIYSCRDTGDQRCCVDCEKDCEKRCMNHPDRCWCWSDVKPLNREPNKTISTSDVLRLAERGLLYKDIAAILHCSISTVGYHIRKAGGRRINRGESDE